MNNMWPHRATPVSCDSAITVSWTMPQPIRAKQSQTRSFSLSPETVLSRAIHWWGHVMCSFKEVFACLDLGLNLGLTPVSLCEATTQGVGNPEDISAVIEPAAVWTCSAQGQAPRQQVSASLWRKLCDSSCLSRLMTNFEISKCTTVCAQASE